VKNVDFDPTTAFPEAAQTGPVAEAEPVGSRDLKPDAPLEFTLETPAEKRSRNTPKTPE